MSRHAAALSWWGTIRQHRRHTADGILRRAARIRLRRRFAPDARPLSVWTDRLWGRAWPAVELDGTSL